MFTKISLHGWRQFDRVDIDFHPRLTVLTGANATGKTTILNLLNRHMGWNLAFVTTAPKRGRASRFWHEFWNRTVSDSDPPQRVQIGEITYSSGASAQLLVPPTEAATYQVEIANLQHVPGTFVSSHRPVYFYENVTEIPTQLQPREELFRLYLNDLTARYVSNSRRRSPTHQLKRALIGLATFGYGNQVVRANPDAVETFESFQRVLRIILPPVLAFDHLEIRLPDVVLVCETSEFSLDAVSGGIAALIDVTWQILLQSQIEPEFTVLIDEPENHLHPELQRAVLPSLLDAFPTAQFIVATHNPFIVSAVPESHVYVLRFAHLSGVIADSLDMVNKAGSSNEILRQVLGLPNTMPIWVEQRIEQITEKYASVSLNESVLQAMKEDLSQIGLADLLPETLTRVLKNRYD